MLRETRISRQAVARGEGDDGEAGEGKGRAKAKVRASSALVGGWARSIRTGGRVGEVDSPSEGLASDR